MVGDVKRKTGDAVLERFDDEIEAQFMRSVRAAKLGDRRRASELHAYLLEFKIRLFQ